MTLDDLRRNRNLLFWALHIVILYRGMEAVRVFENWAAPIVLTFTRPVNLEITL